MGNCHKRCRECDKRLRNSILNNGLCKKEVSYIDGLPIRCVGEWAKDKIYMLKKYFGIFSVGMKNKWSKINYIEICSGPGICIVRECGQEFFGTPLSIITLESFRFIKNALFIDFNSEVVTTLNKRIENNGKSSVAKAIKGDYNNSEEIESILANLSPNALNLVFLDPTDCRIPFSLIEVINNSLINVDFIVNVAFGTDLKRRNLRNAIRNKHNKYYKSRKKYLSFLGSDDFFDRDEIIEIANTGSENTLIEKFLDEYKKNLSCIGYKHTELIPIKHFYYLFFASKHNKGLEFWKKAKHIDSTGQYDLFN